MSGRALSVFCAVVIAAAALACAGTGNFGQLPGSERERFGRCRTVVAANQCGDHYRNDDLYRINCENTLASQYAAGSTEHARMRWLVLHGCPRDMVGESMASGSEDIVRPTQSTSNSSSPTARDVAAAAATGPCEGGRTRAEYTAGRCCWPGQYWNGQFGRCAGTSACPAGTVHDGDGCARE